MNTFFKSWHWLNKHPYYHDPRSDDVNKNFSLFPICVDILPVMINPKTKEVDDNRSLNTEIEIWIETGNYIIDDPFNSKEKVFTPTHDYRLDCGAPTYEEAIIELAILVKEFVGDYKRDSNTEQLIYWNKISNE